MTEKTWKEKQKEYKERAKMVNYVHQSRYVIGISTDDDGEIVLDEYGKVVYDYIGQSYEKWTGDSDE